jgi:hypothetical protein
LTGANEPVSLYVLPPYVNTIPSIGTIVSKPPIRSIFLSSVSNFLIVSILSDVCSCLTRSDRLRFIFCTAESGFAAR